MAWKMNYTDQYGENHPESYWVVAQTSASPRYLKKGIITFNAFHDETQKGKRIIAQKVYSLLPDDYQALVQVPIPNPIPVGVNTVEDLIMAGIYAWAKSQSEIGLGANQTGPSFFADAVRV